MERCLTYDQVLGLEKQRIRFLENAVNPKLQQLFLEITKDCNLSCIFCGSECNLHQKHACLDVSVYKGILEDVKTNFGTDVFIVLTGGEPLLYPQFEELISLIDSMGFSWGITTNGTLLSESVCKMLMKYNCFSVGVSLDGLSAHHDAVRRVESAYADTIKGIYTLSELGFENIQITTVAVRNIVTKEYLTNLWNVIKQLPITNWRLMSVEPIGSANKMKDLLLRSEDYRLLLNFIYSLRHKQWPVYYSCCHYLGSKYEGKLRDQFYFCSAGLHVASITCDGDIVGCLDIERRPETVFGNIQSDLFSDIWKTGFQIFRDGLCMRNTKCLNCPDVKYCRGDSAHSWDYDNDAPKFCIKECIGG